MRRAREALEAYLAGPADTALVGLPANVRLLGYDHDARNGLLRVNLSYSPAVRALATERPETMRRALLGLIATLTSYPEVQAVMLDFEGRARLGVGQCAELLRTPQRRPGLLNDARLIAQGR
jgi:spore germination protein GerM